MSCDKKLFDNMKEEKKIRLADKNGRNLTSEGIEEILVRQSTCKNRVRLTNVLYVPNINANLLTAKHEGNAYHIKSLMINDEIAAVSQDIDVWHRRLEHASKKIVEQMDKEDLVVGMKKAIEKRNQCKSSRKKNAQEESSRLDCRKTNEIMEDNGSI